MDNEDEELKATLSDMYAAAELALYAIDSALPVHEGHSDHAELLAAFKALEAALNKADGTRP